MTKTILLVEDESSDVFLLKRALKKAGIENPMCVVENGQLALDYLQGTGKFGNRAEFPLPCLVLLDLKLPKVAGLDVLKWIRQQSDSGLIVLILTSSRDQKDISNAYRFGANGYLVKPADLTELLDIVQGIQHFWLRHNVFQVEEDAQNKEAFTIASKSATHPTARPVI